MIFGEFELKVPWWSSVNIWFSTRWLFKWIFNCWIALKKKLRFFIFKNKVLFPHFSRCSHNWKAKPSRWAFSSRGNYFVIIADLLFIKICNYIWEWIFESTVDIIMDETKGERTLGDWKWNCSSTFFLECAYMQSNLPQVCLSL